MKSWKAQFFHRPSKSIAKNIQNPDNQLKTTSLSHIFQL